MEAFLKNYKQPTGRSSQEDDPQEDITFKEDKKAALKPWVEKYRPNTIEEVVYQNQIIAMLSKYLKDSTSNGLPNLLFYGPPGTGKTSTIIALAKELFQKEYKNRVLELNASDERGISVIREKVKSFAKQTVSTSKSIPSIKLVILDECDSMTRDAQSALRRTMEKDAKTTRFCLICNYVSRIIEPLVSRCSVFRFKLLDSELSIKKLRQIADLESVRISDQLLSELVSLSEGDLRRAITLLQSSSLIKEEEDGEVTIEDIHEVSGYIPKQLIEDFIEKCRSKSYERMTEFVEELIASGYSGSQFLLELHEWLIECDKSLLSDQQKAVISQRIAFNDKRLLDGADEFLQIIDIGAVVLNNIGSE